MSRFVAYIYEYHQWENDDGGLEDDDIHKVITLKAATFEDAKEEIQNEVIDKDDGDFPDVTLYEVNNEWEMDSWDKSDYQVNENGKRVHTWSKVITRDQYGCAI